MKNREHNEAKGGKTSDNFSGSPETFQNDSFGTFTYSSFPNGWLDFGAVGPPSGAPQPSAVVIMTTDAYGHSTKAVATLPSVALAQGIFRPIDPTSYYTTHADVRIDQFGDTDPTGAVEDPNNPGFLLCGCPVGFENNLDWAGEVGFLNTAANPTNPAFSPGVGISASSETHTWHLWAESTNIVADIDLGLKPVEGKWYGVEVDLNAMTGALHGVITDAATGTTLADKMVFLTDPKYGAYDPNVDGVFDTESYMDGELTLVFGSDPSLNKPGLAVFDNIDTINRHPGNAYGSGHDHSSNTKWDGICSDHG